jgi:hypothetical protein
VSLFKKKKIIILFSTYIYACQGKRRKRRRDGCILFGLTACSIRPPFTVDESTHLCKSKHHPRHLPPCAAKVCIAGADDLAVDECESAHIINLFPCLCCYHTQTLCNRIYRGVLHLHHPSIVLINDHSERCRSRWRVIRTK